MTRLSMRWGRWAVWVLALIATDAVAATDWALDTFCAEVQRFTTATTVPFTVVTHQTTWDYRHSKPGIEPVVIHQYVTPDATGRPKMVSCKVKSVDHLQAVYGPAAAGQQGSCEQVTRSVVEQARSRAGARAPTLVIEPEARAWTGSSYLSAFELLTRDASGTLHLNTRYLRTDWEDWRWYVMPNRLRGHLYCHVIAPEYLARLLEGEPPELQPVEMPPEPGA